jgi:hypothetical protein
MAALPVPVPGALYATPPIPGDFAAHAPAAAVPPPILSSCHAVTNGPDRHLHWVYSGMVSSATAITTPVTPSCCFETQDSIAVSQGKTRPRQRCALCNQSLARHMTAAQATTAFTAHAAAFPATHAALNTLMAAGVFAPAGYASANGITAPIAAPAPVPAPVAVPAPVPAPVPAVVPGPAPAPAPVSVPAPIPVNVPLAAADPRENPSSISVGDVPSYQMLSNMVKVNTTSVWSADMEAHQFVTGLELILRGSPVRHEYWTALLLLMIPGSFSLERDWVYTNIISQRLSWNQARAAFTRHYQRSDYMDGRRELYARCVQAKDETTQEYSRRFQTLATQLRYPDNDSQCIHQYLKGLPPWLQKKMQSHKSNMRTLAAVPVHDWDFASLSVTISLAIMFAAEPQVAQRKQDVTPLPAHLQTSVLANPHQDTSTSYVLDNKKNNKRKGSTQEKCEEKETEKKQKKKESEKKECQYHPSSTTHTTEECRTKGKTRPERSPRPAETPTPVKGKAVPQQTSSTMASAPQSRQRTTANQQRDLSSVQCYNCRKYGHYASTCTQPSAPTGQPINTNRSATSSRRARVQRPQVSIQDEVDENNDDVVMAPTSSIPHTPARQE